MIKAILIFALSLFSLNESECWSDSNKFILRYAMSKVRDSCVGEKVSRAYEDQVRNVVHHCRYNGHYPPAGVSYNPKVPYGPSIIGSKGPPVFFLPDQFLTLAAPNFGFVGSHLGPQRVKRSSKDANNFLHKLVEGEEIVRAKLSNMTCILTSMGVIDINGQIDIPSMTRQVKQLPSSPKLKEDLIYGIHDCAKFASCLPPQTKRPSLIPFALKRAYLFSKCGHRKRHIACIKQDIRKNIHQAFPTGLRGSYDLDEFTERMVDVLMAEDIDEFESLLL